MKHSLTTLIGFLIIIGCTNTENIAGGSTDVETGGIAGVAYINADSTLSAGTQLILTKTNKSAINQIDQIDSIATTTVNQEGLFEFSKLDSGLYNIEAYHSTTGKRNININIDVFNDSIQQIQSFMHTPSTLTLINIPEIYQSSNYQLYIPGFRLQKSLSVNTSEISIDSIPAGVKFELRISQNRSEIGFIAEFTLAENEDLVVEWDLK